MKYIPEIISSLVLLGIVLFGLFCAYTLLVWAPVNLYTEAQCLKKGYPKHAVSVGLERYCMNLDGSITVKVDHISK